MSEIKPGTWVTHEAKAQTWTPREAKPSVWVIGRIWIIGSGKLGYVRLGA